MASGDLIREKVGEPKEPKVEYEADLREELDIPWAWKTKKSDAEELAKKVQTAYDEKPNADWLRMLGEGIIKNMKYAPIEDLPWAYDNLKFEKAVETLLQAFKEKLGVDTDREPKQRSVSGGKK